MTRIRLFGRPRMTKRRDMSLTITIPGYRRPRMSTRDLCSNILANRYMIVWGDIPDCSGHPEYESFIHVWRVDLIFGFLLCHFRTLFFLIDNSCLESSEPLAPELDIVQAMDCEPILLDEWESVHGGSTFTHIADRQALQWSTM